VSRARKIGICGSHLIILEFSINDDIINTHVRGAKRTTGPCRFMKEEEVYVLATPKGK
jgi:hypothetical protein